MQRVLSKPLRHHRTIRRTSDESRQVEICRILLRPDSELGQLFVEFGDEWEWKLFWKKLAGTFLFAANFLRGTPGVNLIARNDHCEQWLYARRSASVALIFSVRVHSKNRPRLSGTRGRWMLGRATTPTVLIAVMSFLDLFMLPVTAHYV